MRPEPLADLGFVRWMQKLFGFSAGCLDCFLLIWVRAAELGTRNPRDGTARWGVWGLASVLRISEKSLTVP